MSERAQYWFARDAFDKFAGMWPPELPPDPLDAAQVRVTRWATYWWGALEPARRSLALLEELGEFVVALDAGDESAVREEFGDLVITMALLATTARLSMHQLWVLSHVDDYPHHSLGEMLPRIVAQLARLGGKRAAGLRGMGDDDLYRLEAWRVLRFIAIRIVHLYGYQLGLQIVAERVDSVTKRTYGRPAMP